MLASRSMRPHSTSQHGNRVFMNQWTLRAFTEETQLLLVHQGALSRQLACSVLGLLVVAKPLRQTNA